MGTCLQATGAPGELMHDSGASLGLLRAGPAGFAPVGGLSAGGEHSACATVAGHPDGAAFIGATNVDAQGQESIVVANRRAGPSAHP